MPVKMDAAGMLMYVGMRSGHWGMAGRKFFAEPFHGTREVENAEQNEHQADGKFQGQAGARRNHQTEENDGGPDDSNREGVAAAPEDADSAGFGDGALAADDSGNGNDMIGIGGVAHAEKKTDRKNGEAAGQRCAPTKDRKSQ